MGIKNEIAKQGGYGRARVAAITRGGTPTYTASGLKLKFGFY